MMDWKARIARAQRRGKFNYTDKVLAASWRTCAVGERERILHKSAPTLINAQGHVFMRAVQADIPARARQAYLAIQRWTGAPA